MDTIERGRRAEVLLNDPVLKEAFDGVREALVMAMEGSPVKDADLHHQIALSLQLLKQLQSRLHNFVATGQAEIATAKAVRKAAASRSLVGD